MPSLTAPLARPAPSNCASNAPATTPPAPNAPSTSATPTTGSSRARWSRAGKPNCATSPDAEAELARQAAQPAPPARADIEALARDLPRLWAAPSTSHRDRKRLLRSLINDVTLTSQRDGPEIEVGIHWRSGASDQLTVLRPQAARTARAAAGADLLRELAPTHTIAQLAEQLNQTGQLTASGRPFDEDNVRRLRWQHRVPSPSPFTADEIAVHELAQRINIGDHIIYIWIRQGKLSARRVGQRRLAIRFDADIEAACHQRLADSPRTRYRNQQPVDGGAE